MTKALVSVTGLDTTGIIAGVAAKLSEMNINILDITQTILDGYFTMMMVVDLDGSGLDFEEINRRLQPVRDAIPSRGSAYAVRNADSVELPLRHLRARGNLEHG